NASPHDPASLPTRRSSDLEGVVLAMQDRVSPWIQVGRSLNQPGEQVQRALAARAHGVHAVGRVAVLEQALEHDAQEPVAGEEDVDRKSTRLNSSDEWISYA